MKTLILSLIAFALFQTTILGVNLVLLVLILRSFVRVDISNLYLAFFMGLLMSHLNFTPLGVQSISYLILVTLTQVVARSHLSAHFLTVVLLGMIGVSLDRVLISLSVGETINIFPLILYEGFLSIPIFVIVKFWEERFIVKDIKLKI